MRDSNCKTYFRRLFGTLLFLVCCLPGRPQGQRPVLPAGLQSRLAEDHAKNDLSDWIYVQLQWVAEEPVRRWALLMRMVDDAWRKPATEAEMQAWLDLLTNQGYFLLLDGAIVPSTDAYSAAYDWAQQHPEISDPSILLENILKPLGNNYTRLGDYEQALFIHQKALAIALAGKDKEALAGVFSNLANTSSSMGQPLRAREYCSKGLAVSAPRSALSGLLFSEQADACLQLRDPTGARTSIDKSISILEGPVGSKNPVTGYWLMMAYQQAGDIYSANSEKALHYYQKALDLEERLSQQLGAIRQREKAKLFQRLSALFARANRRERALYWSDRCLGVLLPGRTVNGVRERDLYGENTLADLLYTRARLAKAADSVDEALHLYTLFFATERKLRQALITGSSREGAVADSRAQYEEAMGVAWNAWERTGIEKYKRAILHLMEGSKAQLLLDEIVEQERSRTPVAGDSLENRRHFLEKARIYYEKEGLETGVSDSVAARNADRKKQIDWELARLRKKMPEESRLPASAELSVDSLAGLFEDGQRGRLYFLGSTALYSLECGRDGIGFVDRQPLTPRWEDSLRQFVQTWFQRGTNAMIDHPAGYYRQAYRYYRVLFGAHPFEDGKQYILFPDGALGLLPMEALVTDANCPASPAQWPFVIKRTQLSYGWSLETYSAQRRSGGIVNGFSGFFLSGGKGQGPLLAATKAEEDGIKQILHGGRWFSDSVATADQFREALETSAVVHISSHGFIRKNGVDAPHIELYDQPFFLFELQGLAAHPALVVLSACRTGDGRIITGDGVQSLARAFTAGGTNAVVSSWWNLNDEAAARLMGGFYAEWVADESGNAAAALRRAKLNWLNDPHIDYVRKLPYFWAAVGYLGNPKPFDGKGWTDGQRQKKQGPWWTLFLLPVAAIIIWVFFRGRRAGSPR